MRVRAGSLLAEICKYRYLQLHYSHAMSDLRVCKYNDPQLRVRVSSYSHVALASSRLRAFPRLMTSLMQCLGPRHSLGSGSRSDSLPAGVRHASCTEMHYSPRNIKAEKGPEPDLGFPLLCSPPPLPPLLSPSRGPPRPGQWRPPLRLAPSTSEVPASEPGTRWLKAAACGF